MIVMCSERKLWIISLKKLGASSKKMFSMNPIIHNIIKKTKFCFAVPRLRLAHWTVLQRGDDSMINVIFRSYWPYKQEYRGIKCMCTGIHRYIFLFWLESLTLWNFILSKDTRLVFTLCSSQLILPVISSFFLYNNRSVTAIFIIIFQTWEITFIFFLGYIYSREC